jgi:16S rRNA (guanine(966)-N(2))-methyltransferase RsmD
MLIGAGYAKGLKLKVPKGDATRPTAARVRASILDMLTPWLDDARFLDLFAGSGAMGIEAVSRGAASAVFVEDAREAQQCLAANVAELVRRAKAQDLEAPKVAVLRRDVKRVLPELAAHAPFDVAFADPPYRDAAAWVAALAAPLAPLVAPEGIFVVETAAGAPEMFGAASDHGWQMVKQRTYGDTMVTILARHPTQGAP